VRLALLVVLALLGMAAAYPFAGGSRAAIAGTTTSPSPDPAPTTTGAPTPEPARHPAPPPPAQTHAPPPPAPVAQVAQPRHVGVTPARPKHPPARPTEGKEHPAAGPAPRLLRPQPPQATTASYSGPLTSSGAGLSGTAELLLGTIFALALLVAGLALAPADVLPTPVFDLVVVRREVLLSAAGALVVGLAAGLVVLAVS
jgi:hypothetical protein